jgi:hypothetical protein
MVLSSASIPLGLNLVPKLGRVVATLSPATGEIFLEGMDARRLPVRFRPFRKLAGS